MFRDLNASDVIAAADRIRPLIRRTPLVRSEALTAWLAQNDPGISASGMIPESCGIDAVGASKGEKIDA